MPSDATARLQLGRSYIKCGLYAQALEELAVAAQDPKTRATALYERIVAGTTGRHLPAGDSRRCARDRAGASEPRSQHWFGSSRRKLAAIQPTRPPSAVSR